MCVQMRDITNRSKIIIIWMFNNSLETMFIWHLEAFPHSLFLLFKYIL